MTLALHCDRPGCDTWAREGSKGALQFLTLTMEQTPTERELGRAHRRHFCTLDCLMHWAAEWSEPTQVVGVTERGCGK